MLRMKNSGKLFTERCSPGSSSSAELDNGVLSADSAAIKRPKPLDEVGHDLRVTIDGPSNHRLRASESEKL